MRLSSLWLPILLALAVPVQAADSLSGNWVVVFDMHGRAEQGLLALIQDGEKITGKFDDHAVDGTLRGNQLNLTVHKKSGDDPIRAVVKNRGISGTILWSALDGHTKPDSYTFTAVPVLARPTAPPRRHDFKPTTYHNQFSALNAPVLHVAPGDTIATTTIDAAGYDANNVGRSAGGNPQTGPFYIDSAMPGDMLAVHFKHIRLNRDWAITNYRLVDRAVGRGQAVVQKDVRGAAYWKLDREKMTGTLEKPGPHLANFSVPLKPMLGCVGVATQASWPAPDSGDAGTYGGNMDFNEIVEGTTVYLPVLVPGALLYVGDGHAVQGDGELAGAGLETSMDVEFTVDIVPGKSIPNPRVESPTHIMAMALAGSIDTAIRAATGNMANWLAEDYKLEPAEVTQVLGTVAQYRISEIADRDAGVVMMIDKERLKGLK